MNREEQPVVSILIPVYNVPERYLRKCIESCISQTLQNIEIIIVDDGSSDNSGDICDEYASHDKRIHVIHKANGGLAAARNDAFESATGEYISFLDGDDYLENKACEVAVSYARSKNVQIVLWNQMTEYSNSSKPVVSIGNDELEFRGKECKELQLRVLDFNGKIAQVFCKLINRQFLVENNIRHNNELKQGAEGFVFNIALFEHAESAYYIPDFLLHYTYNENSISHSANDENNHMIVRCFEYINGYIQNSENSELLEKKLYNRMLYVICTTAITGYFNPNNKEKYSVKKNNFKRFMKEPLIEKAFHTSWKGIQLQRKIVLLCVKFKQYWALSILGYLRKKQLSHR